MKNMNARLKDLYESHWDHLEHSINTLAHHEKPTHPLLIQFRDEEAYINADQRIMIVGKETNDWEGQFGQHSLSKLQETYMQFLHNQTTRAKQTLFWRYTNELITQLSGPDHLNTAVVWNNIYKLGLAGGRGEPSNKIKKINFETFNVFEEELKIIQPDMIIFLTGPVYDEALRTYLPGIEFVQVEDVDKRKLAQCIHPSLPHHTYRTYHPQYLNYLTPGKSEFHRNTPIEVIADLI
ncbi:hypothetical protein KP77_28470 [Jeotgalibacillus alimentarius]|uniref:Uracil-DNA glycosylase-like domain-containing protein n=1 Tax=Jeotgalibacillus alimentarius TaxID=135826 RepID=A0A0C2R8V0_9BACL|nr:hypothetical protein [Jeotgalibacillus alimentarius]KIL46720.1 hypothetical protein KP77_28470 [Jeotgalibacillus alimentarius]